MSLKALALKVLERNKQGNHVETRPQNSGNFEGKKRGESFHDVSGFEDFYVKQKTGTGQTIYLTPKREIMERYRQDGQAWFLLDELDHLRGLDAEALTLIVNVKEAFTGAEAIKTKKGSGGAL